MPEEKTVFISYRRSVSTDAARALFLDLRYNGYDVFLDVDSINSGQFERIILRQIEARAHFVLILTPGTLERCIEPDDWLRREIEHAMDQQRNIVPLFVSSFTFTGMDQYLTGKLANLPRFNGLNVPHDYFEEAMTRLMTRFLKQPVYGAIAPTPISDQPAVQQKIEAVVAQSAPTQEELTAEEYFNRARQMRKDGDLAAALADYNEAIRLNPKDTEAYNSRGITRHQMGDLDAAIADYGEALRLKPQNALAYCNRGEAYFAQGKFAEALENFQIAYNLRPSTSFARCQLALTYHALGEKERALMIWRRLTVQNQQYYDADWVGKELEWSPPLIEAARQLIAEL